MPLIVIEMPARLYMLSDSPMKIQAIIVVMIGVVAMTKVASQSAIEKSAQRIIFRS